MHTKHRMLSTMLLTKAAKCLHKPPSSKDMLQDVHTTISSEDETEDATLFDETSGGGEAEEERKIEDDMASTPFVVTMDDESTCSTLTLTENTNNVISLVKKSRNEPTRSLSRSTRTAASTASPTNPRTTVPLKSALRSTTNATKAKGGGGGRTMRRVRGLWGGKQGEQCTCYFTGLHDELFIQIFSYLSSAEVTKASRVCQRWNHITSLKQIWKHIDATDFVYRAFDYFCKQCPETAAEETSKALSAHLNGRAVESLVIRDIQYRLTANVFLPDLKGLSELVLTGFADLTDTHVHVMLLSHAVGDKQQARSRSGNSLRKLRLENCPNLTNSTVRSIARTSPHLAELSLRGNRKIDSVMELKDLWKVKEAAPGLSRMSSTQSFGSLSRNNSFFVAPQPKPTAASGAGLSSLFAPPPPSKPSTSTAPPSTATGGGGLASLFAPPPPKQASPKKLPPTTTSSQGASPSSSENNTNNSSLLSLFVSPPPAPTNAQSMHTKTMATVVTAPPAALDTTRTSNAPQPSQAATDLSSLFAPPSGMSPPRPSLRMNATANAGGGISAGCLTRIDLSHTTVTPSALIQSFRTKNDKVQLEHLLMRGQEWKNGDLEGLASTLQPTVLKVLDIGCSNTFVGSNAVTSGLDSLWMMGDDSALERLVLSGHGSISISSLCNVLLSAESVQELNLEGCKSLSWSDNKIELELFAMALSQNKSLNRLSLHRCFSDQRQATASSAEVQADEQVRLRLLLDAIGKGPAKTLTELDLGGCWFVDEEDELKIRSACLRMTSLRLQGTRAKATR